MEDGGETKIYGGFRKEEKEIGTLKRLDISHDGGRENSVCLWRA